MKTRYSEKYWDTIKYKALVYNITRKFDIYRSPRTVTVIRAGRVFEKEKEDSIKMTPVGPGGGICCEHETVSGSCSTGGSGIRSALTYGSATTIVLAS